jgi:hypothetical protein
MENMLSKLHILRHYLSFLTMSTDMGEQPA